MKCKYEESIKEFNSRKDKPKSIRVSLIGVVTICDITIEGEFEQFKSALKYLDDNDPFIDAIRLHFNGTRIDNLVKNNYSGRKVLASDKGTPKGIYKKNWSKLYKRIKAKYPYLESLLKPIKIKQ